MSAFIINPYIFGVPEKFWVPTQPAIPVTLTSFVVTTSFGVPVTATWGDGTTQVLASGVATNKTFNKSTSGIDMDSKNVMTSINCGTSSPKLGGSVNLKDFQVLFSFICVQNDIDGFIGQANCLDNLPLLGILDIRFNKITGSIPNLSNNTQLTQVFCNSNLFSGDIPNLSANTNLQFFFAQTNNLTGFSGGTVSSTLGYFQAHNNKLTSDAVNAILAAFVAAGRTSASGTCILKLEGVTNGAPTGQGITDKATLQSRGWTVTTS